MTDNKPLIRDEVADILYEMNAEGNEDAHPRDTDWPDRIIAAIGAHLMAEAVRVETINVPSLAKFGAWAENEARCREWGAILIQEFAGCLSIEKSIHDIRERSKEDKALFAEVRALIEESDAPA